jgi:hypothetical protein
LQKECRWKKKEREMQEKVSRGWPTMVSFYAMVGSMLLSVVEAVMMAARKKAAWKEIVLLERSDPSDHPSR